jgi:hypothetical protein
MIVRVLGLLAALGFIGPARADEPLRAGVAAADITPPVGWRLAGNFGDDRSTGVNDPLKAKALVFGQGSERFALLICDLTGMPRETAHRIRDAASRATGIPADHIRVGATHTHGAPLFYDHRRELWHGRAVAREGRDAAEPIDYEAQLIERGAGAIAEAAKSARPVRLRGGVVRQEGLAFNRRFWMKDGTVLFNPGKRNPGIVRPAGPVDPELHLLFLDDPATGRPAAALSVFAMHVATFGDNNRLGADFPGHIERILRGRYGEAFVSLFGEGTAGDTNHVDVSSDRPQTGRDEPARIGQVLARTILDAEPTLQVAGTPRLAVASRTIRVPLRPASPEDVARAKDQLDRHARGDLDLSFLEVTEAHRIVDVAEARKRHGDTLPMDVTAVRLDDATALVLLPHEVFVELGLAIKAGSPYRNTMVITMCDGVDFYVPTRKAYAEGSYEVVNSRVEAGAGEALVEAAAGLLKTLDGAGSR